jgi:serine/threonine protein kinase
VPRRRQLISAVAFLHEHGHVHCDIKPQNILYQVPPFTRFRMRRFTL